jgi:hypothetical protein
MFVTASLFILDSMEEASALAKNVAILAKSLLGEASLSLVDPYQVV